MRRHKTRFQRLLHRNLLGMGFHFDDISFYVRWPCTRLCNENCNKYFRREFSPSSSLVVEQHKLQSFQKNKLSQQCVIDKFIMMMNNWRAMQRGKINISAEAKLSKLCFGVCSEYWSIMMRSITQRRWSENPNPDGSFLQSQMQTGKVSNSLAISPHLGVDLLLFKSVLI